MSERDEVLNYRTGPDSERPLEEGERLIATFEPDRARYWRDHALLAAFFGAAAMVVLILMGKADQIVTGVLAAFLAIGFRAVFFRSEVMARRWRLTDRRLLGPQAIAVMLLEVTLVRRLMGDVQVVTKTGGKHLLRHMADPDAVVSAILRARAERAERVEE